MIILKDDANEWISLEAILTSNFLISNSIMENEFLITNLCEESDYYISCLISKGSSSFFANREGYKDMYLTVVFQECESILIPFFSEVDFGITISEMLSDKVKIAGVLNEVNDGKHEVPIFIKDDCRHNSYPENYFLIEKDDLYKIYHVERNQKKLHATTNFPWVAVQYCFWKENYKSISWDYYK